MVHILAWSGMSGAGDISVGTEQIKNGAITWDKCNTTLQDEIKDKGNGHICIGFAKAQEIIQGSWVLSFDSYTIYGGYFQNSPAAQHDAIAYKSIYLTKGTYKLYILGTKFSGAGIMKVDIINQSNNTNISTTNFDCYNATTQYNYLFETDVSVPTSTYYNIRIEAVDKNTSSTNYQTNISELWLAKVA